MNKGTLSMVLGIIAIALSVFADCVIMGVVNVILVFIALALGIMAIVFGVKGRKEGGATGAATAGLVTGIIAVVFAGISCICVISAVVCVAQVASTANSGLNELSNLLQ